MSNHGHVTPNEDGSKARCGGPSICFVCSKELARKALTDADGRIGTAEELADTIMQKLFAAGYVLIPKRTILAVLEPFPSVVPTTPPSEVIATRLRFAAAENELRVAVGLSPVDTEATYN